MVYEEARSEGRFIIKDHEFSIFGLTDGRYAVDQSEVYEYFTGKKTKTGARYFLSLSKLKNHLPSGLLNDPEFAVKVNGADRLLFSAEEWVLLCKGVIMAGFQNDLSKTWEMAPKCAQLLLMAFAMDGINKTLSEAIRENPFMTSKKFDSILTGIINFKVS